MGQTNKLAACILRSCIYSLLNKTQLVFGKLNVAPNNGTEKLLVVTRRVPLDHLIERLVVLLQEGLLDLDKINLQRDRECTWCVNYNGLHILGKGFSNLHYMY